MYLQTFCFFLLFQVKDELRRKNWKWRSLHYKIAPEESQQLQALFCNFVKHIETLKIKDTNKNLSFNLYCLLVYYIQPFTCLFEDHFVFILHNTS